MNHNRSVAQRLRRWKCETFNKIEGIFVSIHVEDRYMTLVKRSLKSQTIDYEGAQMQIENLSLPEYKRFYLSLSQTTNLEMDSGVNCKNYPTKEFSSYQECDESFVYNEMKNKHKIMPFWAAKTLDEVTTLTQYHFDQSNYTTSPYYCLIAGIDESNCPLPCKITKVFMF